MKISPLKWQKFAGYIFPILVGWVMILWILACSYWIGTNPTLSKGYWGIIILLIIWVLFFPVMGFMMGIVNSYCWKNLNLGKKADEDTLTLLILFWLFTFPVAIVLVMSLIGFVGFLFHMVAFWEGQQRGKIWITNSTVDKFLGRKNDWERD